MTRLPESTFHNETSIESAKPFFAAHKTELQELFGVLGHADDWSDNLLDVAGYTQANWVGGDHWKPRNREQFTPEQAAGARDICRGMGLVEEVIPPSGVYDQVVILGGMMRANTMRTEFAAKMLQRPDIKLTGDAPIIFWGGPRARDDFETPWVDRMKQNLDTASNGSTYDRWWQRQRALSNDEKNGFMPDELAEGRASLLLCLGALPLTQMHLSMVAKHHVDKLNDNVIKRFHLERADTSQPVILLNAPTVERPQGEARHTTESAADMWITELAPPMDSRVLFVTSNPYVARTSHVVREVLASHDRSDVELEGCGPAAYDDAPVQLFLGEIGRLVYEDTKTINGPVL